MQDSELYARILGITEPWRVERVDLRLEVGEVHVFLGHAPDLRWDCPECGAAGVLYDHQPERQWHHLDTCQCKTILHAEPPRSNCSVHGPRVVKLPWAEPGSRFTLLFEALAIHWLRATSKSGMHRVMNLSWDEAHLIQQRAVARGMARRTEESVKDLGVDEKSFRKRHRYLTIVNDFDRGRVLFVAEGRSKASLDDFWQTVTEEQVTAIRSISFDMWDPYIASIKQNVPDAAKKIVFDKFHVAAHLGKAVDAVRRRENKALRRQHDRRLVNTKWSWLQRSHIKTARAWALKETAMDMYLYRREHAVRAFFDRYAARGYHSMKNFITAIYFHCGGLNMDPLHLPT